MVVSYFRDPISENRGLRWSKSGDVGAHAAISGTKVEDAFAGSSIATVEVVVEMQEVFPRADIVSLFGFRLLARANLGSLLPALWAARRDPVKALHHE